ncbi:hypothetical protein DV738_g3259, partial [Chaetothyriales sp. CBS 135597]
MASSTSAADSSKPIHTIILDSSPLLLNTPGISTLLANAHVLVTTPSVLAEIKNEEAKSRVETLYTPFLQLRSPRPESVGFVKAFARKTGDAGVLSQTDFEVLALAYDLECERNGGDWRLRNAPGQKRLNGSRPEREVTKEGGVEEPVASLEATEVVTEELQKVNLDQDREASEQQIPDLVEEEDSADSDDGWITPSNIKRRQAQDEAAENSTNGRGTTKVLQVATMTGDFAMQNVLLQINLNLLSTKTCKRISQIKQFILRCTTNDKGEVKLHLKANMQWNNRGNVYSIPKPVTGSANQKWKGPVQGGGKGGWGSDLILAEDQKEYLRAMSGAKRAKAKDLMDEDTLPAILTGERDRGGGRPRTTRATNTIPAHLRNALNAE